MLQCSAFRKSLLFSALSLLLSAPTAFSNTAPATVSSVQSAANTGAATTSIPIDVPPGRKGIQPNLALTYNSNSPNGWLGVGWSLDMGAIQRSTKRGVSYSANDYVANGAELVARGDWGSNYYGAKTEGAFSKYYFDSSTGGWVATTKDGTKYYYGTTAASRQDSALGVFKWCLDKVVDTNGNYMTVAYLKDQNEMYLFQIDYSGNSDLIPTNQVKFYNEARSDKPSMYTSNSPVARAFRLKYIEVSSNGQLVRKYVLAYSYSNATSRSLLASVTQYGADGVTALPSTTIAWPTDNAGGYNRVNLNEGGNGWNANTMIEGDYNGDGKTDFLSYYAGNLVTFFSNGDGTYNRVNWYEGGSGWEANRMLPGDYNGDGKGDFLSFNGGYLVTFFSNGNGTYTKVTTYGGGNGWDVNYRCLGDFNGDGKTDFLSYSGGNIATFFSNGDGTYNRVNWYEGGAGWNANLMLPGDFNGDGKGDFLSFTGGYLVTFFSNGNGTYTKVTTYGGGNGWDVNYRCLGDYNGDGKTDFLSYSGGNLVTFLSKGDGTYNRLDWYEGGSGWLATFMLAGDYNGDGKGDFLSQYGGNLITFLSKGDGTYTKVITYGGGNGWDSTYSHLGDFNGDGRTDYLSYYGGNIATFFSSGTFPDLLTSLSNGLGATTTITYKPSSSYTNGLLPFIVQTVSSISVYDGLMVTSTTNYSYWNGNYNPAAREFRGFLYVKATNPVGTNTETWFYIDDIFKGIPYSQLVTDASGNRYTLVQSNYQYTIPYTGVAFPYVAQRDDYLYDGATTYKLISTAFTYDAYGNITRKYSYGNAAATGDELDENIEYSYDTANWIVSLPSHSYVLDSGGAKKAEGWFTYDIKGNLLTETRWLNGGANPVVTYTYDAYGNRASVKDARNNTTTITYDTVAQTYPVTITNALGHAVIKTWDYRYGKPLTETDANGNTTSYTYDVLGRLYQVKGPLDSSSAWGTVTYQYFDIGLVGSQRVRALHTEQHGNTDVWWEETYFDGLGRTFRTRKEGPDNKVIGTLATYNSRGGLNGKRPSFFEGLDAERWVGYHYDAVGRLVMVVNPDGTYATTAYDKGKTTIINPNGQKKVEEKDVYGRLVKVEEYNGGSVYATTLYQYDILGNLTGTTDAKGNQSVIAYDTLGRKTGMTDPDMGAWSYAYDAGGNLTSQTDAKNQTITFAYDALNRVTKKDYPAGTDAVYTYDETASTNGKGRFTTLTDASGTSKYWYDALGRTTKNTRTIDGVAYTTQTQYDALSRPIIVWYPDGETVNYGYDTGGNLSQVGSYAMYTNYNALGQVGTVSYGNGVSTTYQYQTTNNRLSNLTIGSPTQTLMSIVHYYDNVGNITAISDFLNSGRNQSFTYDSLNRLTQAYSNMYGTLSYSYDQIGNMTAKEGVSYTYPANGSARPHAVTATSDGKSYTYDNNGNMTTDGLRTIAYDYDNMPSSVTIFTPAGAAVTSFVYDASGQRVKKITPTTTTVYVGKLYECTNGSCTKYIMAGGNKVAWKNSAGTFYYHQDHLGSSRVITDASGTKAEELTYLPYGATLTDSGNGTVSVEHRFTSQEYDAETGLYYYNARYYNPGLGRFVSADSIVPDPEDPQAFNRYSYTLNNPVIYTDPTGNAFEFYSTRYSDSGSSISISYGSSWSGGSFFPSSYSSRPAPRPAPAPAPKPAPAPAPARSSVASNAGSGYSNFSLPTPVVTAISGLVSNVFIPIGSAVIPGWGAYDEFSEGNYLYGLFSLGTDLPGLKQLKWGAKAAEGIAGAARKTPLALPAPSRVPNAGGVIRSFAQESDQVYYRVYSESSAGGFLTAIPPKSSAWAREALSLHGGNQATFIQEVLVPAGTRLQRSRALSAFGRGGGAEQFELLEQIPATNFGTGRLFQ